MFDAPLQIFRRHARAEFKHLDVFRLDHRLERRKINHAGTRRTMVAGGKLHIVNVKARQPVRQRTEMHDVMDEP